LTRVVVDADYLVYSCGFATEHGRWDVSVVRPDGSTDEAIFEDRDAAQAWIDAEPEGAVSTMERIVEAEPLDHALHLVNRTLNAVDSKLTESGVKFDRLELYITGSGNFRESLATIKGYKANRSKLHRPVHYDALRRFLKNRWGAEEVSGMEADDAVAMAAHAAGYSGERIIIVTVDKDLLTVPGRQYNFRTKKIVDVLEEEARTNFYRQLLTGDAVDNVGGCWKTGATAAEKAIGPDMNEEEMYDAALALYAKSLGVKGCPYTNMSAEEALLENARLLHLRRSLHDVWVPPSERRELLVPALWADAVQGRAWPGSVRWATCATRSSGAPSSSAVSAPVSTPPASSTGMSPVPSLSVLTSPPSAIPVGPGTFTGTPCTPPTSSSVPGPSRRRGSSRPRTASE
jgi:hypothetical protein